MAGSGLRNSKQSPSSARKMIIPLILRLIAVIGALAVILFSLAGRLDWLQGWLFVLGIAGFLLYYGIWALINDPGQLEERSRVGENTKGWDKLILRIYTILLIGMLILASLDAGRFKWSPAPVALQVAGWVGLFLAGRLVLWAASTNTFLSRTVRIQEERGQQVISTGPYGWVRHPMYTGVIVIMVCVPLVLGSSWAVIPGVLIGILFIIRTALEDRTLQKELVGYQEYAQHVKYRLLPGVW
jgi:protein-S-isoprenylcysteine O-methyltransferase Ste14